METNENNVVLIVDDNNKNLQLLGKILHEKNYRIAIAKNGVNAIELTHKINPDLILLDIMMPEMDGYEVCSILKKDDSTKEIPIIFITAKSELSDLVKGFRLGAVDYIVKPFQKEELLVRVETQLKLVNNKRIIQEQNQKLEQTMKSREQLYSIIAHDLRSPLGSIRMSLQAMLSERFKVDSNDAKVLMKSLLQTTTETSDLLENLLLWSKFKIGKLKSTNSKHLLQPAVQSLEYLFKLNLTQKKIKFENKIPAEHAFIADDQMTKTILRNFISNAIKFTPEEGEIKIASEIVDDKIHISVSDTGIGIKEEQVEKLFKQDTHFTSYGTNNEKGSGLGLLLCQDFATGNNGEVKVESVLEKGSTFTLILPGEIYNNGV